MTVPGKRFGLEAGNPIWDGGPAEDFASVERPEGLAHEALSLAKVTASSVFGQATHLHQSTVARRDIVSTGRKGNSGTGYRTCTFDRALLAVPEERLRRRAEMRITIELPAEVCGRRKNFARDRRRSIQVLAFDALTSAMRHGGTRGVREYDFR